MATATQPTNPGLGAKTAEATLKIFRGDSNGGAPVEYRVPVAPGMVVLDALHYVQALARDAAEVVVHRIRITPRQLAGRCDPQPAQVGSDGGADIRDVLQPCQVMSEIGL